MQKDEKPASPDSGMSLDEVVKKYQETEDKSYFAMIYAQCKTRTFWLCLRMLNSREDAEDFTQEAYLLLQRKIDTFRGDCQFTTWFHRLTVNLVLMHLRKKGLRLVALDEVANPTDAEDSPLFREFGERDLSLASTPERLALQRAISELPLGYRLVFVLHDIEGYDHSEIAALLDCTVGNSKSQLFKARRRLRLPLAKLKED